MRKVVFLWALWSSLLLAGCGAASPTVAVAPTVAPTPPPTVDETLLTRGITVYRAQYCGSCHTLSVANTHGMFGPPHDSMGLIAAERLQDPNYTGQATTIEAYLRESILEPLVYDAPGYEMTQHSMPAFVTLPEADLDALVYLLAQQNQ
ncbi:MAG: c-type cytochrome [Phototrophicaceae bacterium]|jgi:mono/diheme cytochrome c family protein